LDDELRGFLREALELYRRHVEAIEKTHKIGWRWFLRLWVTMAALCAIAFLLIAFFARLHILYFLSIPNPHPCAAPSIFHRAETAYERTRPPNWTEACRLLGRRRGEGLQTLFGTSF
jgi:hypothetical protein